MSEELDSLEPQKQIKTWAAWPICSIRVRSNDGFINFRVCDEYNPILKELIERELDSAGIHSQIYRRLIAGFDYDTLTHERTFRYRRMVGSANPGKMVINLVDGTPVTVIATYDF